MIQVDNKKIAQNTIYLYFRMMFLMLINLYASRLILKLLGIEDFGIYNVVGGLVSAFTFIGSAMIASTQRYLSFYLGKDDIEKLQEVFNASLRIHLFAALIIILLCESVGLWFLYNKLVIPYTRINAAFWTFQCSIISTAFIILSYPYNASIIAHEKMKAFAYISIYEAIMKLLIVYALHISKFDKLITYACLFMLVQVSVTFFYRLYCYKNFQETKLSLQKIPYSLIKEMVTFSGWNFFGNIAHVFLNQGTNILLNLFFGPTVNAAKGISVQVQNVVNNFFSNFQTAQNPQIIKTYAANNLIDMKKLIFRSSRFSYYLALLISIPIILKINGILKFWLANVPNHTASFVVYTMFFCLIQTIAVPLHTGCMATGKVKKLMLVTSIIFYLILPLGYMGLKLTDNPIRIFQIQLILYLLAQVARIYIIGSYIDMKISEYIKEVIWPILLVSISSFCLNGAFSLIFKDNIIQIICFSICSIGITGILSFLLGTTQHEKQKISFYIKNKIRNL